MSKGDNTKLIILKKAFDLAYAQGYQLTSIDDIIAQTHVTKGSFYYHFKNKDAMGISMIHDVLYPGMQQALIQPLQASADPITDLYEMMRGLLLHNPFFQVKYGCPAINLIEEMAPVNKKFHTALHTLMERWHETIVKVIENGKKSGKVNKNVNGKNVAVFLSAGYAGARSMGKIYGEESYHQYLKELKKYLQALS